MINKINKYMIPALIVAAASLVGAAIGYASSRSTNKSNAATNAASLESAESMQDKNLQYQTEMWEKTNQYNSPANQKKLYQAAGLNPYAMMGENSFSSAVQQIGANGSVPSSIPMQSYQPNFGGISDAVSTYYDSRYKEEQLDLLKYQNDMKETDHYLQVYEKLAEITHKENLNENDRLAIDYLRSELRVAQASEKYKISQNRADANRAQAEADHLDWQNFWDRFTSNLDYKLKEQDLQLGRAQLKRIQADIDEIYQRIRNLQAEGRLTEKAIDKAAKEIASIVAETEHNKKYYPIVRSVARSQIYSNLRGRGSIKAPLGMGIEFNTIDHPNGMEIYY